MQRWFRRKIMSEGRITRKKPSICRYLYFKVCPLCSSFIKLFHINLKEQVYLCENVDCMFPLGYEDIQIVPSNFQRDDLFGDDESDRCTDTTSKYRFSATDSCMSTASWAEIEKLNKACESEDGVLDVKPFSACLERDRHLELLRKEREAEKKLQKRVRNIRNMNIELMKTENKGQSLENPKLIQNLMHFQEISGCQLLKEDEMIKMKKQEPQIGLGELKIDICESADSISSITIAICTPEQLSENAKPPNVPETKQS